jgi:hypothetical protein
MDGCKFVVICLDGNLRLSAAPVTNAWLVVHALVGQDDIFVRRNKIYAAADVMALQ